MKVIAKKHILTIDPYQPGKPIDELKRELGLKKVIKLASNESPHPPAPGVLRAIRSAVGKINRYPDDGCFYLREALAQKLRVQPAQLIFGNGSDEIIDMTVRAFVGIGDEVVIAYPSFLMYGITPKIEGASIVRVALKGFFYDLEAMRKAVTKKTRLIFIGNPDNPAGTYVNARQLEEFLRRIPQRILVFIDEAYYEFAANGDYPDALKLMRKFSNVIVSRTFSKIYGLAGLRIGYGIASIAIMDILNRVRPPFNVNSLAQVAALACLKEEEYYLKKIGEARQQKKFLAEELMNMGLPCVKTATNFLLLNVGEKRQLIVQELLRRGIIVRDMRFWGLDHFIRVSVGTPQENQAFLKHLRLILKKA